MLNEIPLILYPLMFIFGAMAGFINVLAGGGSLLTVPIMLFFGIEAPIANGTNRIAILAQNISATLTFIKKGYKDLSLSFSLALCAIPGAIFGAYLGVSFDGIWFNRTIALIMFLVMISSFLKSRAQRKKKSTIKQVTKKHVIIGHLLMIGIGFYGGIIQIGVGFLFPFVLNTVMGIDLVRSNMHKVFVVLVYTIASLIIFSSNLSLLWLVGAVLACGNALGGFIGAKTSIDKGEKFILIILNLTLGLFIIKLLF